ncbi:MAG: Tungstate-binding protein TupA [Alphaproteobacteria bacterium MarineAlpha5_Bin11]|nr:hypothetical protein [Pelagibacteraceae bacterium]PPR44576.1 MAG: Tungstate-binding protein TupA [Alphaproteobacteria bacterium MarineAlpha5_Bin11]PPR50872.1 MAG: Tungstate-binding protein TupA [Alphaproteobacteria bacterium MarineAlpha5_Bin10]|tara:strand:+ start:121 stop:960 length:840 start_codon:yes stop_codon:yes gene_type:complete
MIHCLLKLVKLFSLISIIFSFSSALLANDRIIIGTTTSTYDSGLMPYLANIFQNNCNCKIHVITQGTGQVIRNAMRGNIDVLIVHDEKTEEKFMTQGYGIERHNFMYNNFVIVGPKKDPANIENVLSIKEAMENIYNSKSHFISRGDDSGTHNKEISLWRFANLDPKSFGSWYMEIGQGMGASLTLANAKEAYTLTDIGTLIYFNNSHNLKILYKEQKNLMNQYSVILVEPSLRGNNNFHLSKKFVNWILSKSVQEIINDYRVNGHQLFFPNSENYKNN